MSLLFAHRPHYPFPLGLSSPKSLLKSFSLFSSSLSSEKPLTLTLTLNSRSLDYGPSLFKGRDALPNPSPKRSSDPESDDAAESIDRSQFSRVFNIAALRVPAADCAALERRLRGHLLNWPRIRNVARVEGDDVDPDLKNLLKNPPAVSEDRLNSLDRKSAAENDAPTFSPVLYREKLVKDFNCRGYIKFRNLAKISRPKKKKRKGDGAEVEMKGRGGKDEIYVVEVVEDDGEEDWSVLIGEGFKGGKWSGPTRLLLLDKRYAKKGIDEMPEAIKVALNFL